MKTFYAVFQHQLAHQVDLSICIRFVIAFLLFLYFIYLFCVELILEMNKGMLLVNLYFDYDFDGFSSEIH
jgi:hypothetical protein